MKTIYLCGPIAGRSDADCMVWREYAKTHLGENLIKNPMDRDYRGREIEARVAAEIVEQDKADILQCTHVLLRFDKPSVGTSMEALFAWTHGIEVHVVNVSGWPLSPWLLYHSTRVYGGLEEACRALI